MSQHVHDRSGEATPFWRTVHATMDSPEYQAAVVFITSEDDPLRGLKGGVVKEAVPKLAAQCVVSRTHRLAKPDEIAAYKSAQTMEVERLRSLEEARKQTTIMKPSAEQNEALAGAVGAAVQAVLASQQSGKDKRVNA